MLDDLAEILVTEEQIQKRVIQLGERITKAYQRLEADELTVICVTNGAILFTADLIRRIALYVRLDSVRVSSYRNDDKPVTDPQVLDNLRLDLTGRHVLLIDDILDTGKTLRTIQTALKAMKPASLKTCVLLNKEGRRQVNVKAHYVGFDIPDKFVVGYGLDFAERYRNLPCIGVLRPELQNPPEWR